MIKVPLMDSVSVASQCRLCLRKLSCRPILIYKNVPDRSQNLVTDKLEKLKSGITLRICQCKMCGLVQLDNDPSEYYRDSIRSSKVSHEMIEFRRKQFGKFISDYNLEGNDILEVGCGNGDYLSILNEFNINAVGVEHSNDSVNKCINSGLKVIKGYLENNGTIRESKFDAFVMLNFLEHSEYPSDMLKGIGRNLEDGGYGLIEVPNFDMILRENLFSEFVIDHLSYFTKNTFKFALQSNGFDVISCDEIWNNYILSAVVRKRKFLDISHFKDCCNTLRDSLNSYINLFNSVAVWGAGHQSFSVLSLCDLSNKIKYIIDDAEFKQNKYTPVTNIKIVSPDYVKENPVDSIIIIAGSYSEYIINKIKEKYSNIHISMLNGSSLEIIK